ncbi:MAG: hypothetical protein IT357_06725 [Gemmatimonadaceae bacterium]|nr:hypothetical protein [Gemmatimonadaceae bacterium]
MNARSRFGLPIAGLVALVVVAAIVRFRSAAPDSAPVPSASVTSASPADRSPGPARDRTLAELERAYGAALAAKDIGALVALDREVEAWVARLNHSRYQAAVQSDSLYGEFTERSGTLGIGRNGFDSGEGEYDGRILAAAHTLNPNSAWRAHTLWSQIFTVGNYGPPDLAMVRQYLREFPSGPFAADAAEMAGTFYHDLYMTLRDSTGDGSWCVDHLITKAPRSVQIALARDSALAYLDIALRLAPSSGLALDARTRVAEGAKPGTRYHCPD